MSFCHLVPPQDTKWHKVPLSGRDTKWHNVYHLGCFAMFVTMTTTKTCISHFLMVIKGKMEKKNVMPIKKVVKNILVLGKLF